MIFRYLSLYKTVFIIIYYPMPHLTFAKLQEKKISVYACQAGAGAEKAISKLKDFLGIADFSATAVFIDPKTKPSKKNNNILDEFCNKEK